MAAVWLFWIIPFWNEFQALFLMFAAPDALTPSYVQSIQDLIRYTLFGFLTSPFPFHYSLIGVLGFFGWLIVIRSQQGNRSTLIGTILIALLLAMAGWTARLRIHRTYNLIWIISFLIIILPSLWNNELLQHKGPSKKSLLRYVMLIVLVCITSFQMIAHGFLAGLDIVGELAALSKCGSDPHAALISLIPPKDKVVTNVGYVFYQLRERNPIYWPAGLSGQTPGLVPFNSTYDDSFQWLIITDSLDNDRILEHNPGIKFAWDQNTLSYFRVHYSYVMHSDLRATCNINNGLSRFGNMARVLYLYRYNAGQGR